MVLDYYHQNLERTMRIVLFLVILIIFGCEQANLAIELSNRVREVENVIQEKCNIINRAESVTTSNKIKYIKILILKGFEGSDCDIDDIRLIVTNFLEKEFNFNDIPLYVEYSKNGKKIIEEI